jgi:hypothetical protein
MGLRLSKFQYRHRYLKSRAWREKSNRILQRDKICRMCEVNGARDAHHLTYANVPNEREDTDLIGVCRPCHQFIHKSPALTAITVIADLRIAFDQLYPAVAAMKKKILRGSPNS